MNQIIIFYFIEVQHSILNYVSKQFASVKAEQNLTSIKVGEVAALLVKKNHDNKAVMTYGKFCSKHENIEIPIQTIDSFTTFENLLENNSNNIAEDLVN